MELVKVNKSNRHLITHFLRDAGDSLAKFRYFSKRPVDVLDNHLATYVITEGGNVLCYGHLDREGDTVWLGIAATEKARGKGLGNMMMTALVNEGKNAGLPNIILSVDNDNHPAIALYKKFGFVKTEERDYFSFYRLDLYPKPEIAVSTLAFAGRPAEEVIDIAKRENFILEFSSGMPYRDDMEEIFLQAPVKRYAHNYFPAPKDPFVLNLASKDDAIRQRSIEHCRNGLRLAAAVRSPFFSAHAGFCVDPKPTELGQKLSRAEKIDREHHWMLFIDSVTQLMKDADKYETGFLIENNVLAPFNVYEDGTNPLLCVDGPEMVRLMKDAYHPRLGLLLDTAHLKVSARTLLFDIEDTLKQVVPYVRAIHHSDNDGNSDTNEPLGDDYWFMKHMSEWDESTLHVIEVKKLDVEKIKQQSQLLRSVMN